jgi:hypothetical protein
MAELLRYWPPRTGRLRRAQSLSRLDTSILQPRPQESSRRNYLDRPLKSGLSPARIAFTATACPPMFRKLPHINGSNSFLVIVSLLVRISIINCTPEGETRFPFGPWPDPRMSKRPARHCSFRIALCGAILAIRRSTRAIPRSMRSNRSSM